MQKSPLIYDGHDGMNIFCIEFTNDNIVYQTTSNLCNSFGLFVFQVAGHALASILPEWNCSFSLHVYFTSSHSRNLPIRQQFLSKESQVPFVLLYHFKFKFQCANKDNYMVNLLQVHTII